MVAATLDPAAVREEARVRLLVKRRLGPDPWLSGEARDKQHPPPGSWRVWLVMAGRGWGKSRCGAEWVRLQVTRGRVPEMGIVGPTSADTRDIMVDGPSGILRVCERAGIRVEYEPSKRKLTFPNGMVAHTRSADEPDRIRGLNLGGAWADEVAAWRFPDAWSQLDFACRYGDDPRIVATTTPKPVKLIRDLAVLPDTVVTRGSTQENRDNLASTFIAAVERRYEGTRLGRQELGGELLDDVEGALWSLDGIDTYRMRLDDLPDLTRIVVAIDPQAGYSEDGEGSETGIVVAGRDADGHGYLLRDLSGNYQPHEWAGTAVAAYREHDANAIVIETNQGGKMASGTIKTVDRRVPIVEVHASRGKLARAEPVASLAAQGFLHHVGAFPKLEDQLTGYVPDTAVRSPDRLDAYVWAMTEMLLGRRKAWAA